MDAVLEATRIVVRLEGLTRELSRDLPAGLTDASIRELLTGELQVSPSVLDRAVIERSTEGITVREQAPWG